MLADRGVLLEGISSGMFTRFLPAVLQLLGDSGAVKSAPIVVFFFFSVVGRIGVVAFGFVVEREVFTLYLLPILFCVLRISLKLISYSSFLPDFTSCLFLCCVSSLGSVNNLRRRAGRGRGVVALQRFSIYFFCFLQGSVCRSDQRRASILPL